MTTQQEGAGAMERSQPVQQMSMLKDHESDNNFVHWPQFKRLCIPCYISRFGFVEKMSTKSILAVRQ